jgi:hypothetical protein
MNEPLCHALIRAGLDEEDVAARLQVDPKTVRRWMEGRMPYRRYRWALAAMLHVSDTDLWPQFSGERRPDEVVGVYPHRGQISDHAWLRFFGSASREIAILACSGIFLAEVPGMLDVLRGRAEAGVKMRICLRDPQVPGHHHGGADDHGSQVALIGAALALYGPLRDCGDVQIRLHRAEMYNRICIADDQLLLTQSAYGIAPGRQAVLHLRQADEGDLVGTYLDAFDRIFAGSTAVLREEP